MPERAVAGGAGTAARGARVPECEHEWTHLRVVPFEKFDAAWGDEFFCRRCLAKRKVAR